MSHGRAVRRVVRRNCIGRKSTASTVNLRRDSAMSHNGPSDIGPFPMGATGRRSTLMPFYPVLLCKACGSQFNWLPFLSPYEATQRQIPWPRDGKPRNFVCPRCSRGCEYSAADCHWRRVGSPDEVLPSKPLAVYRISFPCDKERCAGLIHIQAVMTEGLPRQAFLHVLSRAYLINISCERGHVSYGPWRGNGPIEVQQDSNWELQYLRR